MKNIKILMVLAIISLNMNCSAMTGRHTQKIAKNIGNVVAHSKLANIAPLMKPMTQFTKGQNHPIAPFFTPKNNDNDLHGKLTAVIIATSLATTVAHAEEDKKEKKEFDIYTATLKNHNQLCIEQSNDYSYLTVKNTEGEKIAIAVFYITNNDQNEKYAYLCHIDVNEEFRHNNIGSDIINHIINFAKAKNCASIKLCSINNTKSFYKKLGFIITAPNYDSSVNIEDRNIIVCTMEKIL